MNPAAPAAPQVNDLVALVPGGVDDNGEAQYDPLASRVEDVVTDDRSGQVQDYLVAAPLRGDDGHWIDRDFSLRWVTPRGVGLLPVRVVGVEVDPGGLQQWRVRVTGPARRDQRRRFARVAVHTPVRVTVLPPPTAAGAGSAAIPAESTPETAQPIEAVSTDVSEGGVAVTFQGEPLPEHAQVRCSFAVGGRAFELTACVVRSVAQPARGGPQVRSALQFLESGRETDELRKRLYQVQLENRRRELDAVPAPPPVGKARRRLW